VILKTTDLINQLTSELKPVQKVKFTYFDQLKIILFGFFSVTLAVLILGFRQDISDQVLVFKYVFETIALLLLTILSTLAAFSLSVPNKDSKNIYKYPFAALVGFLLFFAYAFITSHESVVYSGHKSLCAFEILIIGAFPSTLLFFALKKAAILNRNLVGFLILLTGTSFGLLATQLTCIDDTPLHILVWHILPATVILLLSIISSKKLFKKI
jgi:hypothetical protein